jgi:hypothetical protein
MNRKFAIALFSALLISTSVVSSGPAEAKRGFHFGHRMKHMGSHHGDDHGWRCWRWHLHPHCNW